jgi:hypothetical protein
LQVQEIFEKYGTVTEAAVVGSFGFVVSISELK